MQMNTENQIHWGKIVSMKNYRYQIFGILILGIAMVINLAACNGLIPGETGMPEVTATGLPTDLATEIFPVTTATQTKATVILMISRDADSFALTRIRASLEELVANSGLELVIQEGSSIEMPNNVPVVVALGEGIDVNSMANNYTGVSFIAVDNDRVAPSDNVSVIGDPIVDQQRKAFMAGYLAALISEDYKVAALAPADANTTDLALESFVVGVRFFCGICLPKYPPYGTFPQWETLPVEVSADSFQPVLDNFENIGIEVFYIHGDLNSPTILTAIEDKDILVVSDRRPDINLNNYVGAILSDPAPVLESIWDNVLRGDNAFQSGALVALVDRNPTLVSDGRYLLFLEMVDDLQAGLVYPQGVP